MATYYTGDILEATSLSWIPLSTHYGIYFIKDGLPYVAHNPLGPNIVIEPFSDFTRVRTILRVAGHSSLSDRQIYEKALELQKTNKWNLFTFSCEDFVRRFCNCNLGIDQRIIFASAMLLLIILIAFVVQLVKLRVKKTT